MIIPYEALSIEALNNLIQEYCLRDWGLNETESPLEERRNLVMNALKTGELVIIFSEQDECAYIKAVAELNMEPEVE